MPSTYSSRLRAAIKHGIQRAIVGKDGAIQDSVDILIGQGKVLFGNSGFLHPLAGFHLFVQPNTASAARSNPNLVNQRRNLSVIGALSRTFSTPSVSGPPFQVFGYHIDNLVSDPSGLTFSNKPQRTNMAAIHANAFLGDWHISKLGRLSFSTNNTRSCYNKNFENHGNATMSLRKQDQPNNYVVFGYFAYNGMRSKCQSDPFLGSGSKDIHSFPVTYFSARSAPDVSFDNSSNGDHPAGSTDSTGQKNNSRQIPEVSIRVMLFASSRQRRNWWRGCTLHMCG